MQLPAAFVSSYCAFKSYPESLQAHVSYGPALRGYRERLNRRKAKLFSQDPKDIVLPIRTIDKDANGYFRIVKLNILSEEKLKAWLGDAFYKDPGDQSKLIGTLSPRPDPRCLIISLISESQLAPLKLNRNSLLRILSYYQVMPHYVDFLMVYGTEEEDRELRFCGFRTQMTLVNPDPGQIIPALKRSGRRYEVCYNLKAVSPKTPGADQVVKDRWKIRQYAIYHRFDIGTGSILWITADPLEKLKTLIAEVMRDDTTPTSFNFETMPESFKSSLDMHLVLIQGTSDEWRWYIQSLEKTIDQLTRAVLLLDDPGPSHLRIVPRAATRVQEYEDKVNEAIMVMESNASNLNSLAESYRSLVEDPNFPHEDRPACKLAVHQFSNHIHEFTYDLGMQISRARVLSKVTADRKGIVIQQLQTQAALKQEALASSMWEFSEKGQKEAIAMRVVTVITLIYLPPTFVSTFFSTDVIKYQDGGGFSMAALSSFLYVTLPLSLVTSVIAFVFYKRESLKRGKRALQLIEKYPEVKEYLEDGGS